MRGFAKSDPTASDMTSFSDLSLPVMQKDALAGGWGGLGGRKSMACVEGRTGLSSLTQSATPPAAAEGPRVCSGPRLLSAFGCVARETPENFLKRLSNALKVKYVGLLDSGFLSIKQLTH